MSRKGTILEGTRDDHMLRNTSALSGALIGATTGILGGVAGVGVAGLLGALLGGLGGIALERQLREADDDGDDAAWAALIEPPCADCVSARAESGGAVASCARHTRHSHLEARLHYEYPQSFGEGSMLLRPAF